MKSSYIMLLSISMLFGAMGVLLRFFANEFFNRGLFPWGTFMVNAAGSLIIGFLFASQGRQDSSFWVLTFAVGFLGALTTFSGFTLDSVRLIESGNMGLAVIYVLATNVICLTFCYIGYSSPRWLH